MAPSPAFAESRLLRPLLNETRESLRQWALAHQLSWIKDESNQDDTYDRNFLRLRVIPCCASAGRTLARPSPAAPACAPAREQLLDRLLAASGGRQAAEDGSLAIAPLTSMSSPAARRCCVAGSPGSGRRCRPARCRAPLARGGAGAEDASPACGWGIIVRRFQQRLYWVRYVPGQADSVQHWPDGASRCGWRTVSAS